MKTVSFFFFILFMILMVSKLQAQVAVYPGIDGLKQSDIYQVKINGQVIWTEKYVSNLDVPNLPEWFSDPKVINPQEMHIANFGGWGKLMVEITLLRDAGQVKIKPVSRNIIPKGNAKIIEFEWDAPGQLVIEADDLPPLFLFANPEEKEVPVENASNLKYFGPGVHHTGYIELKSNEQLYLAPGAVVYGGIRAPEAENITVFGRGIIDGNYEFRQMVQIENSSNIRFEGVTVRNGRGWTNTLINCRNVDYNFVKVIGFGPSSDGINPAGSQNVKITNCFMRCTDDCVAIKAPDYDHPVRNVLVENNIMIGYAYADGVTIGFETNAREVANVKVNNCDILMARGGSRVDGHSGFSIICDGPAMISNIVFENIRVEQSEVKLFELNITDGTLYGEDQPGHINGVIVKDVQWFHSGPIVLQGFSSEHLVNDVRFINCTVDGNPLEKVQDKLFRTNEFVKNVVVKN